MLASHMSNSLLNRADKIEYFIIHDGKKDEPYSQYEYNPYDRKWYFTRKDSMYGMLPCKKADITRAFENDFNGCKGYSGHYQEAIIYKEGKIIGIISDKNS